MATPKPGMAARGSQTGRPVMAALDLLGRRWMLRVLWELRASRHTPLSFRDLRERCDAMSPTVLNQRLRELREVGLVVTAQAGGYALSATGEALLTALMPLLQWSTRWQKLLEQS